MNESNGNKASQNGNVCSQPAVKKTSSKTVREYNVVVSDRIELVRAANEFVSNVMEKQTLPSICQGVIHTEIPLSENEVKTFNAALQFLQRQFETGYSLTEPHETKVEHEETHEF